MDATACSRGIPQRTTPSAVEGIIMDVWSLALIGANLRERRWEGS